MHSLNNAVGSPLHNAADMTRACDIYMQEAHQEGLGEVRALHERAGGWYSSEVMAKAITSTCMRKHGRVEHILCLEPLHVNPALLRASLGAVVNIENTHWVALRWLGGKVWLLDSQKPRPLPLSWNRYLDFVALHEGAFRIEVAPEMAVATTGAASE